MRGITVMGCHALKKIFFLIEFARPILDRILCVDKKLNLVNSQFHIVGALLKHVAMLLMIKV